MVSKFTDKDLAKLEAEAELKIYQDFQKQNPQLGLPLLNKEQERQILLGNERCCPLIWTFFEKAGPTAKQRLFNQVVFNAILRESEIDRYELACNNLAEHFTAFIPDNDASQNEKMAYKNFCYYRDLSVEAMRFFYGHFARTDYFGFSSDAYQQWFSSLRLGLYEAPERVLSGSGSLNYPDVIVKSHYISDSPRLSALLAYLETIYQLRVKVQLLDLLIRNIQHAGNNPNISIGQWENFVNSTRQQLLKKFGAEKGKILFKKLFGSDKPHAPTSQGDFQALQQAVLENITREILREQSGEIPVDEPTPSGFHRDYAKEQAEREKRERENRERKERENKNWANINSAFNNNPNLVKQWTDKGFTYETTKEWIDIGLKPTDSEFTAYLAQEKKLTPEQMLNTGNKEELLAEFQAWKKQPKPKPEEQKREKSPSRQAAEEQAKGKEVPPPVETSFNNSKLNEDINKLKGAKKDQKPDQDLPYTPSPGLGMPLNSIMKEDALKLPWLVMGVNLNKLSNWKIHNSTSLSTFRHGEGDIVTFILKLISVHYDTGNFSNVLHNIFKMKNPDKKGFELFAEPEPLETQPDKLLINGKKSADPRAEQIGWKNWPWYHDNGSGNWNGMVQFGVPRVKQKSYRLTSMFRNMKNAYDLEDTNHFIGVLRSKGLMSKEAGTLRGVDWGSAPNKSILWITNQVNYLRKGEDWAGDDTKTINSDNGFAHYLIFSNLSTEQINSKFINNSLPALNCKTLPELVGKITKEGKGVMVRLGPDALELIEAQDKDQKGRSENETPDSRNNSKQAVADNDLPELGISKEQFEALNTPFTDSAHVANIIKQLANSNNPAKVAQMLNRLFDNLQPATQEAMFSQMVDNNPVFSETEKETLKTVWKNAKTSAEKKSLWETLTSHSEQQKAFTNRTPEQKDKIFEEQVNNNPRYGPQGVDTQERRDRFTEYQNSADKETLQTEENKLFTTGENANQWGNYFVDNANRTAGAGDSSIGSDTDNNFNGQFSFQDSLNAINRLKDIVNMKPEQMDAGMKANQPYWQVIMYHPLTYLFLFVGIIMSVMASVTRKNK